jgi:lysophospholipase L1-like esterase
MRFTILALGSAGLLLAQENHTAPAQSAGRGVVWVQLGHYKEITPERWRARVEQTLTRDKENPPKQGAIMFVGSATIAGWDLKHYFPNLETINRGIGGSMIAEATYYAEQLIIPYKPSTIVFYSGDNDTAYGMPTEMIADDFRKFAAKIHAALPATQMVVLSIRPSIQRLQVWDAVVAANEQLRAICAKDRMLQFVDLTPMLLTADGKPRRELLGDDQHHLNKDGFDLVSPVVAKAIQAAEARRGNHGR